MTTQTNPTNQKFGEILNINNNTKYSISPNSVKLLPVISNDNNYVKLYTETNMSINKGDFVFIMYDDNGGGTGKTILDNYYEYSGNTNWMYLKSSQGYEVLNINESNNEITIKRYYDSSLDNVQLNNHYLCKIYVNKINFYGGWVDGVCFRSVNLNSQTDTYIDIDIKQCIILSGGTNETNYNAYYIDIKDKYDNLYISVNSQLSSLTKKSPVSINPYKYKGYIYDPKTENPVTSYYTKNNNLYGYTYISYTRFFDSIISNGYYSNCIFSGGTIYNGNFINCDFKGLTVESGNFINSTIDDKSTWKNGIWYGSGTTTGFGPSIWYNGIWNEGVFSGKTWVTGIFNNGIFNESNWINGIFNGTKSIFKSSDSDSDFSFSTWSSGTFNGGQISNSDWSNGSFNGEFFYNSYWTGGTFNKGTFTNSTWYSGSFNNGLFDSSIWYDGIFNNGLFKNSIWENGFFNNGIFNTGINDINNIFLSTGLTNQWNNGIFNSGKFINSFWLKGTFNGGDFTNSMWSGGTFNYGTFNNSTWIYGNWKNGIVNNSNFHTVNWLRGTFNTGTMGKKMYISSSILYDPPQINWSGGTFNNGIFGNSDNSDISFNHESGYTSNPSIINWYSGDFYGGKFYNNRYGLTPTPSTPSSGAFYNGVFHEGYFYGVYLGGQWINGYFGGLNWTQQIMTFSRKKNYQISDQISNQTTSSTSNL